jgi:CheY-like chemotaxis protein
VVWLDILGKKLHLVSIWAVALGATLSAAFIMAANSWMQHPVGYQINPATGRPQLTSISALFTNPVFVWGYLHVILASLLTGALVVLSVSAWHLRKKSNTELFVRTTKVALAFLVPVSIAILLVGSHLGVIETTYQPMKVAAMEAQWETCAPCSFSAAQIGGWTSSAETPTKILQIPHLLSVLATGSWNGQVVGINELQAQCQKQYGPGNYIPNLLIQYWSMRLMAYIGSVLPLLALWGAWLWRKRRFEKSLDRFSAATLSRLSHLSSAMSPRARLKWDIRCWSWGMRKTSVLLVVSVLQRAGMETSEATTGSECLALVRQHQPDLVVLDLGLSDADGTEVCRQLRAMSNCYVLMLSASAEEVDVLVGLAVGADGYLVKPFSPREVTARVQTMLRRVRHQPDALVPGGHHRRRSTDDACQGAFQHPRRSERTRRHRSAHRNPRPACPPRRRSLIAVQPARPLARWLDHRPASRRPRGKFRQACYGVHGRHDVTRHWARWLVAHARQFDQVSNGR